jgi:hypothetical protein
VAGRRQALLRSKLTGTLEVLTRSEPPSIVELVARSTLDAELGALVWLLVEGGVPLIVAAPPERLGAAAELLRGVLASVRPDADDATVVEPLTPLRARRVVRGTRAGGVIAATSLEEAYASLGAVGVGLSPEELTFLGTVLILGPTAPVGGGSRGRLRVVAAHYVRPLARDAHGHPQRLGPAVLATWDAAEGHYEHFAWGVLPEIASRLGVHAGDLEADLHHRRDDLGGLAKAGVTRLDEVRRLVAGYQTRYGGGHGAHGSH